MNDRLMLGVVLVVIIGTTIAILRWQEPDRSMGLAEVSVDREATASDFAPRRPTAVKVVRDSAAELSAVQIASTSTSPDTETIRFRLLDSRADVADVVVDYHHPTDGTDDWVFSSHSLDASGRGRFAFAGVGWLVVRQANHCAQALPVSSPGAIELRRDEGEVLRGRVRINGAAPEGPMRLFVSSTGAAGAAALAGTEADLPEAVARALARTELMTRGKTGEFRLAGLVAAWRLDLELPAPFRVATGTLPMADSRPRLSAASVGGREVVLELVEANSIAGRVVSEEGVAAAGVQLLLRAPAGEGEIELARASSAEDGRFMLCDWPTRAERLELLCDWSGMSWAMAIDASEELRRDLGEIRVPASRRVPIQVQDRTTGANLVGASLCRSGSPAVLRTGSRGGVLLPVLESEREVELDVAAPGYQFQRLRFVIPRDGGPGVVVALEPASVLELDCLDDAGRSLPGARVLLRAERALLREPLAAGSAAFASANSQRIRLWERKGRGFGNLLADRQGRLRIEDLQPDLAIDLTLATFGKQESGRLAGVTLHPGETRRIELRSERPLHDLKAAVMAEDGRPLAGAAVRIGRPEGDGYLEFSSDAEGRVCVRGLPLAEVSVTVLMDGFRAERRRVNLGERDQDLAFVLATAPQVDLLFRSGGRVVDPDLCYLRDPTLPRGVVRAERIETGSFRLELPGPGVVDVEVAMGLATHRLRVDPADGPVQTVDLPVHAALVVDGSSLAADARSPVIVFELPNGSCRRLELDARRRLETSLPLGSYRYWVTVEQDGKTATIRPPSPLDLVSAESVEILLR